MAIKRFSVYSYKITLAHGATATWGGKKIKARGILTCFGADGWRFIAYFLTDDSPVPNPMTILKNKVGAIFLPFKEMDAFVDLVRNEKPIYAYLNDVKPEWNSISSSSEPIGEEET